MILVLQPNYNNSDKLVFTNITASEIDRSILVAIKLIKQGFN